VLEIGQSYDAAFAERRAAIVPGLKPIEPDCAEAPASGRVERGAPHSAKTDNRDVINLHFNHCETCSCSR
jgi:hypothetical protein